MKAKKTGIDWDGLLALARSAWGHRERKAKEPPAAELQRTRAELAEALRAIAATVSDDVEAAEDDSNYLVVTAKLGGEAELAFKVGGEGYAWVEVWDGPMIIFDCLGFDDMDWEGVLRCIGRTKPAKAQPTKVKPAAKAKATSRSKPPAKKTPKRR